MREKRLKIPEKYRDLIVYVFFGGMTTIVNYIVYFACRRLGNVSVTASGVFAWCAAVLFAFVTNKPFVFHSHDWSAQTVLTELTKFVSCRIGSGALETVILFLSVDCMNWNGNIWKLVTQVLVIIINYVGSKLLVFRKK